MTITIGIIITITTRIITITTRIITTITVPIAITITISMPNIAHSLCVFVALALVPTSHCFVGSQNSGCEARCGHR